MRRTSKTSLDAILNFRNAATRDPLPSWKWHVEELPDFGDIKLPPEYIETLTLPFPKLDSGNSTYVGGAELTYAGATSVDAFDIVFHEDSLARATKYVQAWQANIQNPYSGGYYLPAQYKKILKVVLKNTTGEDIAEATLKGCWPSVQNNWDLTNTGDEPLKTSVSFEVDAVILKILK